MSGSTGPVGSFPLPSYHLGCRCGAYVRSDDEAGVAPWDKPTFQHPRPIWDPMPDQGEITHEIPPDPPRPGLDPQLDPGDIPDAGGGGGSSGFGTTAFYQNGWDILPWSHPGVGGGGGSSGFDKAPPVGGGGSSGFGSPEEDTRDDDWWARHREEKLDDVPSNNQISTGGGGGSDYATVM